jgi:serine/threonine protein kinase
LLICPTCNQHFEGEEHFCPRDGSPLSSSTSGSSAPSDPLLGRVLGGRYRLEERLGQGGMGTVYRALHTLMDKPVALKILRSEMAADNEAVARFHREARSASKLDHDHCIRVMDFGQSDDGLLFLVMELLDGVSLGQITRRGPVPATRAAAIGVAIAEALEHAHEAGIIHRDLKPDNVYLARRPRGRELVKVLDFGLAKLVHDGALGPSITRDGTVFGTPEYMAPEQAEGEKLDGRTDIYALGIILYQLVTGDVPFRASNFVALLTKQVSDKPMPPRERRPDLEIPEGLEAVILRCLEKKAEDRYATAQELAEALEPFAAGDSSQLMLLPRSSENSRRMPTLETPTVSGDRPSQRLYRGDIDSERNTIVNTPPAGGSPSSGYETSDSVLRGEVLSERGPRASRRRLAVMVGALAVVGGAGAVIALTHRSPPPQPPPAVQPVVETPLEQARKLLAAGDALGAKTLLMREPKQDSPDLQEALSATYDLLDNHLGALAHLERAARLAPKDPGVRARLAGLLFRYGYTADACRNARNALKLDPRSAPARQVLAQANCPASKEAP